MEFEASSDLVEFKERLDSSSSKVKFGWFCRSKSVPKTEKPWKSFSFYASIHFPITILQLPIGQACQSLCVLFTLRSACLTVLTNWFMRVFAAPIRCTICVGVRRTARAQPRVVKLMMFAVRMFVAARVLFQHTSTSLDPTQTGIDMNYWPVNRTRRSNIIICLLWQINNNRTRVRRRRPFPLRKW